MLTAVKIDLISSTDITFFRISLQDRNACYSYIIIPPKFYMQRICFARTSACERVWRQKEPDDPDYPFTLYVLSVFENDNPFTVLSLDRESFSRFAFQNSRLLSPFFITGNYNSISRRKFHFLILFPHLLCYRSF